MPWGIKRDGHKWAIYRRDTGEVVGHSDSKRNAILSVWHRKKAEGMLKPKKKKEKKRGS